MTAGMTVKELLERANAVFHQSIDGALLACAKTDVQAALKNPYINEANKAQAEGLLVRVGAKVAFCTWVADLFQSGGYSVLLAEVNALSAMIDCQKYPNTGVFLTNILAVSAQIKRCADKILEVSASVLDDGGYGIFASVAEAAHAEVQFLQIKAELAELPDAKEMFLKVQMPNYVKKLSSRLSERMGWLKDAKRQQQDSLFGEEYRGAMVQHSEAFAHFNYSSGVLSRKELTAPVKFVSTPFEGEFAFAVSEYRKASQKTLVELDATKLAKFSDGAKQYALNIWQNDTVCIAVYGFADIDEKKAKALTEFFMVAVRGGTEIVVMDASGDGAFGHTAAKAHGAMCTHIYLRMPDFADVRDLFLRLNMLRGQEETDTLRTTCGFMGYVGVNEAINLFSALQTNAWLVTSSLTSERNRRTAKGYLAALGDPIQLLDSGWEIGEEIKNHENEGRKPFTYDYDAFKVLKPENLELILLDKNLPLKAKCGVAVKYCLLNGDDISVWATLEKEDVKIRLTDACRILARLLDTAHDPEVEVLDKLSVQGAAALCCNGGTTIQFKTKFIKDFAFTADSVLHEMFHSFQHTACDCGWRSWHLNELQTSRRRVEEWAKNFAVSISIEKDETAYRCQSIETDTRIFAAEAWDDAASYWHTLSQKFS